MVKLTLLMVGVLALYQITAATYCRKQLDVAFILDRSGSVGRHNHRRALKFIQNIVARFDIGRGQTRVGLVAYSTRSSIQFDLDDNTNKQSLQRAISRVRYTGGATNTPAALIQAIYILTPSNRRGARRDSRIPKVAILLTDGKSNRGNLGLAVAKLRSTKIQVYVIGIGKRLSISQLKFIATDPDSTHVFHIRSYSKLAAFVNTLRSTICNTKPVPVCLQPPKTGPCKARMIRFYFNKKRGKCLKFTYGGCKGNQNNFKTIRACNRRCNRNAKNVCLLPKKVGPCKRHIPRYYFDKRTGCCKLFFYGGCKGNRNNFRSCKACKRQCRYRIKKSETEGSLDDKVKEEGQCGNTGEEDFSEERAEDDVTEDSEVQDLGDEMSEDDANEDSEEQDVGEKMYEDDRNKDSKVQNLGEELSEYDVIKDSDDRDFGNEIGEDNANEDSEEQDLGEAIEDEGLGEKLTEEGLDELAGVQEIVDEKQEGVDKESAEEGLGESAEEVKISDESVEEDLGEKRAEEGLNEQAGEEETAEEMEEDASDIEN